MPSTRNKRIKIDATEREFPNIHPEMAWNDEMRAFYNDANDFDAEMQSNEKFAQWSDISHLSPKERTKCAMCGSGDHATTSCPSSCCLKVCIYLLYFRTINPKLTKFRRYLVRRKDRQLPGRVRLVRRMGISSMQYMR